MGDMAMTIAGASISLTIQQVQQNVQINMLKKGLDTQTQLAEQIINTAPQVTAINQSQLGQNIDVKF